MQSDDLDLEALEISETQAIDDLPDFFTNLGGRFLNQARYFRFSNYSDGIYGLEDVAVRVTEDDIVAITFVEKIHRRVYTHTRNRVTWTGPYIKVNLKDPGDFPLGPEWDAKRLNRICSSSERRIFEQKHFEKAFDLVSKVHVARGPYRYTNC